jgi:hypothetical protein
MTHISRPPDVFPNDVVNARPIRLNKKPSSGARRPEKHEILLKIKSRMHATAPTARTQA